MITPAATNRYVTAAQMFLRRPVSAARYTLNSLLGRKTPVRLDVGGLLLWVRPRTTDLKVVRSCMLGEFQPALDLVQPQYGMVIDAGGYIGLTSIIFAEQFPDSLIVCLEPSAENFRIARQNCAPWPNIEVVNAALAPNHGRVTLKDPGTGHWGFTIADSHAQGRTLTPLGDVAAVTLDELLARFGKEGVDLLKLDIEGAEYALLKERPGWVDRCSVIVAEMHDRICPGATRAFINATDSRVDVWAKGEKRISVRAELARRLAPMAAYPA